MLGVPLGDDEFVSGYVDKELIVTAKKFMKDVADFEDTQIGMYLLRISFGIVRAVHFMRTTPFHQWSSQALTTKFGTLSLTPQAYKQAASRAGLGMRRITDHAH